MNRAEMRRYNHLLKMQREAQGDLRIFILNHLPAAQQKAAKDEIHRIIYKMLLDHYEWVISQYNVPMKWRNDIPEINECLYKDEGWTLDTSIEKWLQEFNKKRNKNLLMYRLCLIVKHQGRYMDAELNLKLVRLTHAYRYVTIAEGGFDETCEVECIDHHGTYKVEETFELPPYHPDCNCIYWFHNEPNSKDEPGDEDWMPEQLGWLPIEEDAPEGAEEDGSGTKQHKKPMLKPHLS